MCKELENNLKELGVYGESVVYKLVAIILDKDGYVSNKKYQVVFVDEYNNWYLVGFFDKLEDAVPEVNAYLESYELEEDEEGNTGVVPQFGKDASLGELTEYASTFSSCFDRIIDTTCGCVQVRGFIF